jgi:hypothetical protein
MVVSNKVISELAATPTAAGYNDGMHAMGTSEEGMEVALSPESARESGVAKVIRNLPLDDGGGGGGIT